MTYFVGCGAFRKPIASEDFIHKYKLKNEATSNIKIQSVCKDVDIHFRDGPCQSDAGIVIMHPKERTHLVPHIKEIYFDSYGCSPPQNLFRFIIKRNVYCLYFEYKNQGLDSYCAAYCLYIICLKKLIGIDFLSVVLYLYYRAINFNGNKIHYKNNN